MGRMRSPVRWLYASGVAALLMAAVGCSAVGERAQVKAGTDPEPVLIYDLTDGTPQNRRSLELLYHAQHEDLTADCLTAQGDEYEPNPFVHHDPSFGIRALFPDGLVSAENERRRSQAWRDWQDAGFGGSECSLAASQAPLPLAADHVAIEGELPDGLEGRLNKAYLSSPELVALNADYLACMTASGFDIESRGEIGDLIIGEARPESVFALRPGTDQFDRAIWAADFECFAPIQGQMIELMADIDKPFLDQNRAVFDRLAAQWDTIDAAANEIRAQNIYDE